MSSSVQAAWPQAKARVQASVNGLFCLFCFKAHEGMTAKAVGTSSFQSCVYQSRQTDHFPSKINYPDMKAGSQLKWRNRDSSSMWLSYTPSASPRMPRDIESHFCSWSSPPSSMTAIVLCSLPTPELHSLKCICCNLLHFYRSLLIGAIR